MSGKEDSPKEKKLLSTLKQNFDELRVQMALGKADASDYVEKQKEKLADRLETARERVEKSPLVDNDLTRSIKTKMDELRLQLALGKMESKESYQEQKEKIGEAIDSLRKTTAPLKEKASDAFAEISDVVESGTDFFKAKLSALGVKLSGEEPEEEKADDQASQAGPAETSADIVAEKAALEQELQELSIKADEATKLTGAELDEATGKLKAAYEEVTRKLNGLLK